MVHGYDPVHWVVAACIMESPCAWAVIRSISNDPELFSNDSRLLLDDLVTFQNQLKINDIGITGCAFLRKFQS
jgi:hypothetical protein